MVNFTIFLDLYECSVDMYARCNLLCLAMRVDKCVTWFMTSNEKYCNEKQGHFRQL